jgi:ATP-dependent helicase/nuclease subunit B
LIIFTNRRAIRSYLESKKSEAKTLKLDHLITIRDFNRRAIFVEGFKNISSIERDYIFNEVVRELEMERVFKIDTEIFNFLSYSKYFFSFFKELAHEQISIDSIQGADYYEDYQKHIKFLQTLYEKYRERLYNEKLLDPIFEPLLYKLNEGYIKSLKSITFYFEGSLSKFQIELLDRVAEIIPVEIVVIRSKFYHGVDKIVGMNLKQNREYFIDWREKRISKEKSVGLNSNVEIFGFKNRFTQIGFVRERIYHFYKKKGIEPQNIGVILLDESFANSLRDFEGEKSNLNFSMGRPIRNERIYQFLNGIYLYMNDWEKSENRYRKERVIPKDNEILNTIYERIKDIWNSNNLKEFKTIIIDTAKYFKLDKKVFLKTIDILMTLSSLQNRFNNSSIKNSSPIRVIFFLFLREFEKLTIDDIFGGKVTVMGLLETRGVNFDAVIVLDFNDEVFPKKEEKDLFINSDVRKNARLPLPEDREALQKVHLERVLQNAKYSAISFVDAETTKISRFFHDFKFGIKKYNSQYERELIKIIFKESGTFNHWDNSGVQIKSDFKISEKPLSNSRLKSFQQCPRGFYFREIARIKPHSYEKNSELIIGSMLHNLLKDIYRERDHYLNENELRQDIQKALIKAQKETHLISEIYVTSWSEKLNRFIKNEVERFRSGVRVFEVEKRVDIENFHGFSITGQIDRVDKLPNGELVLIDYKTSNPYKFNNYFSGKDEHDFQLLFYYSLLKERGENISINNLYYYNLSTGKLIQNSRTLKDFEESLKEIKELEKSEIHFEKNSLCNPYCNYKILCNIEESKF